MSFFAKLQYVPGAIPGKKRKQPQSEESKKEKTKKYEEKRPERKFNFQWKTTRPWLQYDEASCAMKCTYCCHYGKDKQHELLSSPNLRATNPFINGCSNFRTSTLLDHEKSTSHIKAVEYHKAKEATGSQVLRSDAGKALSSLKKADRDRLLTLFRNTHAVIKNNRPIKDYVWLCSLDAMKGLTIGETYRNEKAPLMFMQSIAEFERIELRKYLSEVKFISIMMDGSTDISGDEQEAIYLRMAKNGLVRESFLALGSPTSTCSADLKEFLLQTLQRNGIDKDKIIGLASDGASNMVGNRRGLSTLLRQEVNNEMVNVHCYAHRLELAFRDVFKKNHLYDKLMTLLIGLYYFYNRSHKNKRGLETSMEVFGGTMPTKVTGTRWLSHFARGIKSFLRTYKAYESHLSSLSHTNPKAEGLAKILLSKDVVCFAVFLQTKILDHLVRLSLKLQKPESNVAESTSWVKSAVALLTNLKSSDTDFTQVLNILETGMYEGIKLRGNASLSYKSNLIDGLIHALGDRFELENPSVVIGAASLLLNFKTWPAEDSDAFRDFGKQEIRNVVRHFHTTLLPHCAQLIDTELNTDPSDLEEEAVGQWETLHHILVGKYG